MKLPCSVEMSKHSMRRGGASSARALSSCRSAWAFFGAVVGVSRAHHVAHEGVPRVGGGHVEQVALLAALRAVEAHGAPALLGKPPLDDLGVLELHVEVDLGGDVRRLVVVALEESRGELLGAHVGALVVGNGSTERTVRPSRTQKTQAQLMVSSR